MESSHLFIYTAPALAGLRDLPQAFVACQKEIFDESGIIVPQIELKEDSALGGNRFRLEYDDRILAEDDVFVAEANEVAAELGSVCRRHLDLFLVPALVDYLLVKLNDSVPALISSTRTQISLEELVAELRARLSSSGSIRDLVTGLEEILSARHGLPTAVPLP